LHPLLWLVWGLLSVATTFISLFSILHHYMFRPVQAIFRWNIHSLKRIRCRCNSFWKRLCIFHSLPLELGQM
jgi:hypothetical protein